MNHLSTSQDDPGPALAHLLEERKITPANVACLRRSELGLGVRTVAHAEALFSLERRATETCREWGDFLLETMLDFVVWDERPAGRLDEARAVWLFDQVGDRPSPVHMALLVAILDEAVEVPAWFHGAVLARARETFAPPRHASDQAAA